VAAVESATQHSSLHRSSGAEASAASVNNGIRTLLLADCSDTVACVPVTVYGDVARAGRVVFW
jgi:hypothetical protein